MSETRIDAETYYDSIKSVLRAELFFRISIYAVIIEDGRILLVKTHNNKWYFPGGGLNLGESIPDGLKREAWEELGVQVQVGDLIYADDMIYHHDPVGKTAHLVRLFYACRPLTHEFHFENAEERDEFLDIGWIPLDELTPGDFLPSTLRALTAIKTKLQR